MTAYRGWYVTRMLDVKPGHGKTFAVVAGGTHHLRTPAAKRHNQPFTVLRPRLEHLTPRLLMHSEPRGHRLTLACSLSDVRAHQVADEEGHAGGEERGGELPQAAEERGPPG